MRTPPLSLALSIALLLAGCAGFGGEEGTPERDEEVASTPSGSSVSTPGPGAATAPTPASTPAPTPAPPAPSSPPPPSSDARPFTGSWTHDHQGSAEVQTFDVPPGHAPSSVVITFFPTAATMGCDARAATVVVQSPTGTVLRAQGTEGMYCGAAESADNVTMTPGRWTIWSNGTAPVRSTVFFGGGESRAGPRAPFSFEATHDYVDSEERIDFDVPTGVERLVLEVEWSSGSAPVGCTAGLRVTLTDAEGSTVADEGSSLSVAPGTCSSSGERTLSPVPAGAWTVAFTGQGLGVVTLRLTE